MDLIVAFQSFAKLLKREPGQTLVEYSLLIAFIATALITTQILFGEGLSQYYDEFAKLIDDLTP